MGEDWRSWKRDSDSTEAEHCSVPFWEKIFCTSVCHVPWDRILAAKTWAYSYRNIMDWDDSGALQEFQNAKARYWAEINNLPCEIPLLDPEMYIDVIDHNAPIDPRLVADLYKKPPPPPPSADKYDDLSFEAFLNRNTPVRATGWGDAEEGDKSECKPEGPVEKAPPAMGWEKARGWRDATDNQRMNCNVEIEQSGCWNDKPWENQRKVPSWGRHWNKWDPEQRRRNGRKKNNGYGSRFLKPTQQLDGNQPSSFMADSYSRKTMHAGKPPTAMGQWMPKPQVSMNANN